MPKELKGKKGEITSLPGLRRCKEARENEAEGSENYYNPAST
jgi:hypothetical protein